AAETAVPEAEATAASAATAKAAADAKATEAVTAVDDARVAAVRAYSVLDKAADDALAAKIAAEAALAQPAPVPVCRPASEPAAPEPDTGRAGPWPLPRSGEACALARRAVRHT
ncbi:hypothetical protein ADL26_18110, partial [Thermoactinomyces vulgaris]